MNLIRKYFDSFVSLLYPNTCHACANSLLGNEKVLCTACRLALPETGFCKSIENPVSKLFWGRIPVEYATSLLFFEKGGKYQTLIHKLKYRGKKDIGIFLGNLLGSSMKDTNFDRTDIIVSVPLHKAKLRRRGFNQSDIIARGISEITGKPLMNNVLVRKKDTKSQTSHKRYARWENVEGIFECRKPDLIEGKHVLLIDDVVTTGATLEAAGSAILKVKGVTLSIATTAYVN